MFFVYFFVAILTIAVYALLGSGVMYLVDEIGIFDRTNIDLDDYSLAFILFWPLVVIMLFVFGIKQTIEFIIDVFNQKK